MRLLPAAAVLTIGCTGSIDSIDPMTADPPTGDSPDAAPGALPGEGAVARAREWVDAKLHYCQAPNHQHDNDSDCPSTCVRQDNPNWDPYRSDCSGLVSWAWALPPPGRTTGTFAPFDTSITHVIPSLELRAGDALNNDHHIMLFVAWNDDGTAQLIDEPGCSSSTPYAKEFKATITPSMTEAVDVKYYGAYTAIRYDAAP